MNRKQIAKLEKVYTYQQIVELLAECIDHLEYCGYGDSWEREGATDSGLIERVMKFLEVA